MTDRDIWKVQKINIRIENPLPNLSPFSDMFLVDLPTNKYA